MADFRDCYNCKTGPYYGYDHCPNCGYDMTIEKRYPRRGKKYREVCDHEGTTFEAVTLVCDPREVTGCTRCGLVVA